jgi:hypothetical protein
LGLAFPLLPAQPIPFFFFFSLPGPRPSFASPHSGPGRPIFPGTRLPPAPFLLLCTKAPSSPAPAVISFLPTRRDERQAPLPIPRQNLPVARVSRGMAPPSYPSRFIASPAPSLSRESSSVPERTPQCLWLLEYSDEPPLAHRLCTHIHRSELRRSPHASIAKPSWSSPQSPPLLAALPKPLRSRRPRFKLQQPPFFDCVQGERPTAAMKLPDRPFEPPMPPPSPST